MAFTILTNDYNKAVAAMLQGKQDYVVKMYIEFSGFSPAPPTQSVVSATTDHNGYYTGTVGIDYGRVDVAQYPSIVDSGHTGYTDNEITFTGYTSDISSGVGERGSTIIGSEVYGAAIVVCPALSASTITNDLIIARGYFDATDYVTVTGAKGASIRLALALTNCDASVSSSSDSSSDSSSGSS